jgi:aminoglycoside 6'-N-acetyltransferase
VYPVCPGAATIDYFIGELELVGQGVGTAVISAFVQRIWADQPDATHLVVPVNSLNVASWRALQKAGFRLVAQGELSPDNPDDPPGHEVLRIDR